MEKIANFYRAKSPRERVMLLAILGLIIIFWASSINSSINIANEKIDTLRTKISTAESVLGQGEKIKRSLEKVKAAFDPSKTISASDLQLNVEKCANDAVLVSNLSVVATKDVKDYKINSITLNCRNADLSSLAKFEDAIQKFEPYMYVDKVSFNANSKSLDVKYSIVSINL